MDLNQQGINKSLLVLRRSDGMFMIGARDLTDFHLLTPSTAPWVPLRRPQTSGRMPFGSRKATRPTSAIIMMML